MAGLTDVTQIATGARHTCALLDDSTLTCWGYNIYGQLGNTTNNGTENPNHTPTAVAGLADVTQVGPGGTQTCALHGEGTVTCWGNNINGQLGNTTNNGTNNANPTPAPVAGLTDVTQQEGGNYFGCALLDDGVVVCWGLNLYGQLGNTTNSGTLNPNPTPTPVAGLT